MRNPFFASIIWNAWSFCFLSSGGKNYCWCKCTLKPTGTRRHTYERCLQVAEVLDSMAASKHLSHISDLVRPPAMLSRFSGSACSTRDLSEVIHTKWDSSPSGSNLLRVTPQLIRHSFSASTAHRDALHDFLILPSLTFRWPLCFFPTTASRFLLYILYWAKISIYCVTFSQLHSETKCK